MNGTPRSVAEVAGFVDLLRAACNDEHINNTLRRLLEMPDGKRQGVVHAWLTDLLIEGAPKPFTEAIACLMDNTIAERAYEAIYQCKRLR